MKFLVTLPNEPYYLWQMLVQINNFRKFGYEKDTYYLIGVRKKQPIDILNKIINNKELRCKFIVINDNRIDIRYPASLKPFMVKNFFSMNPLLLKDTFFYTDPDVIFTKKINLKQFETDDIWYLSDTRSYLNVKYIKSKGEQLFYDMCDIVKISPDTVMANDENAGGAQWIIKGSTLKLWDEIQIYSSLLHAHMRDTAHKYQPKGELYPINAWVAEMFATIWVAWKHGYKTKIHKDLDFAMATDNQTRLKEVSILHNTGHVKPDGKHFCKIAYQYSPFNKKIKCSKESASYKYVEEINDTKKKFNKNLLF